MWNEVRDAVTNLDKHRFPYIYISPHTCEAGRFGDDGEWLEIYGGSGDYWIAATIGEHFQRPILNPDSDDSEIELWTSDQGFAAPSRHVIHDLATTLATAKHYFESGEFYRGVEWQPGRQITNG